MSTDDRIPAERYAESARKALAASRDGDPATAMIDLQRANVEALLAVHQQLQRLSGQDLLDDVRLIAQLPEDSPERARLTALAARAIERRVIDETVPVRDGASIGIGVGCMISGGLLAVAAFHFHGWGWLLVLVILLMLVGLGCFGAGMERKPRAVRERGG